MSFWPSFAAWPYAVAGMICATFPLIIHLLNRRRYRTVAWAAMDFLREAMQRNRRILRLRDLLLLLLRTAAVLLVGLALARPFFASGDAQSYDGRQPLHAVLLIDNSLSMGYQSLEGDLLNAAKQRAAEFIERLPGGSKISLIPVCGAREDLAAAPFESKSHALEVLDKISVVGRQATVAAALNQARSACEASPELAKRVVLLTDNQELNWIGADALQWPAEQPIQLVSLAPEPRSNSWIADVRLQDELADTETPATIIVRVRHVGAAPRDDLQVTLRVDGDPIGTQNVTLPGGDSTREIYFEHLFDTTLPELGRPREAVLEASIPPDRLPDDDRRMAVVHVVASLPVVFVDELGARQENLAEGRAGATRQLRKLLAPSSASDAAPLVAVRHLSLPELTRDTLADARLCVIAGIRSPGPDVAELLAQYVHQGGQLLIAAGGSFDPAAWTADAWNDGAGALPAPLTSLVGATPSEAGPATSVFYLDFESLRTHRYFQLAGVSANQLRDLYGEPLFFKAVAADVRAAGEALQRRPGKSDAVDRERDSPQPNNDQTNSDQTSNSDQTDSDKASNSDQRQPAGGERRWVVWPSRLDAEATTDQEPVRVLARFDRQQLPFLLERTIGEGRVVLVTTGVLGEWNTLPHTNAVLIYDRVLRDMLESTLSERNFEPAERLDVPLLDEQRGAEVELSRPEAPPETLTAGFIGGRRIGVSIHRPLVPGLYQLRGPRGQGDASSWTTTVAVAARSSESNLTGAGPGALASLPPNTMIALDRDEPIRLAGAQIRGQTLWWWLVLAVLALLLLELGILAGGERQSRAGSAGARNSDPPARATTAGERPAQPSQSAQSAQSTQSAQSAQPSQSSRPASSLGTSK